MLVIIGRKRITWEITNENELELRSNATKLAWHSRLNTRNYDYNNGNYYILDG